MTTPRSTAASRLVARARRTAAGAPEAPIGLSPAAEPLAGTDGFVETIVVDAAPAPVERAERSAPTVPVSRAAVATSPDVVAAAQQTAAPAETTAAVVEAPADRPHPASDPVPERQPSPVAEAPSRFNVNLVGAGPVAGDSTNPAPPAGPSPSPDVSPPASLEPDSAPSSPMARRLEAAAVARQVTSPPAHARRATGADHAHRCRGGGRPESSVRCRTGDVDRAAGAHEPASTSTGTGCHAIGGRSATRRHRLYRGGDRTTAPDPSGPARRPRRPTPRPSPLARGGETLMAGIRAIEGVDNTLVNVATTAVASLSPRPAVTVGPLDRDDDELRINWFLYSVRPNGAFRNMEPPLTGTRTARGQPPLSLELGYVLTAHPGTLTATGQQAQFASRGLAAVMQALHDRPIIAEGSPELAAEASPLVEPLRVTMDGLDLDGLSKVWTSVSRPMRTTVAYRVSLVVVDTTNVHVAGPPVQERRLVVVPSMGVASSAPRRHGWQPESISRSSWRGRRARSSSPCATRSTIPPVRRSGRSRRPVSARPATASSTRLSTLPPGRAS